MFKKYGASQAESMEKLAEVLTEEAVTKQNFAVIHITKEDDKYQAVYEHMAAH